MDSIDVILRDVVHHKPSAWNPAGVPFLIGRTTRGQSIKGLMRKPLEGAEYRLWGEWKPQKGYPPAFEFTHHEQLMERSTNGVAAFLEHHIDGLGPARAAAAVDRFGLDTLKILREDPERFLEVKGVTAETVEAARAYFEEHPDFDPAAYAKLVELFAGHKFPKRLTMSLLKDWRSEAPAVVVERPYLLLDYPRMGWKSVDAFAVDVRVGYPLDGLDRQAGTVQEALTKILQQGHTYADRADVDYDAFKLIGMLPDPRAWSLVLGSGKVVEVEPGRVSLAKIATAEAEVARRLAILRASVRPFPCEIDAAGLLPGQAQAVETFRREGIMILDGAPGTGKTYVETRMVAALLQAGFAGIRMMAPTGKAAKRIAELLEAAIPGAAEAIQPSTIHRALGPIPSTAPEGASADEAKQGRGRSGYEFFHNESRPLQASLVIVDETSMLDVELAASLLRAIVPGTLLLFVGDANQLPSVGPGAVLRDMIAAGVPSVTLTEVQRNCGDLVRACHDVLNGRIPTPSDRVDLENGKNWIHVEIDGDDPAAAADQIVKLHLSSKRFHPTRDMQTISPEYKTEGVGCNNLNRLLSDALNGWKRIHQPTSKAADDEKAAAFEKSWEIGDKVVRTKNGFADELVPMDDDDDDRPDWVWEASRWLLNQIEIVNGDMGEVVDVVTTGRNTYVVVDFEDPRRRCRLPFADCELSAAYAMTAHKCQGSGFPYVIAPVSHGFYYDHKRQVGSWTREMLYVILSRAEKLAVTVGPFSAIEAAVRRPSVNQRRTRLRDLILDSAVVHGVGLLGGVDLVPTPSTELDPSGLLHV